MQFDFFEEFPRASLEKAAKLPFSSTIYMAAKSIEEFKEYREQLRTINPNCEAAYWPVLQRSYWVSPFSYPDELDALEQELLAHKDESFKVLLDLELPLLRKELVWINYRHYFSNRRRIKKLLMLSERSNLQIRTAEYWYAVGWPAFLTWIGGVSYPHVKTHTPLIMWYPSILRRLDKGKLSTDKFMQKVLPKVLLKGVVEVSYGALSVGVFGNEEIITLEDFKKDMEFIKNAGAKRVTIFRLEGVTDEILEVLKAHAD